MKVLLALTPFWDSIIPPNGIAHLKSYLQEREYDVRTFDFNVDEKIKEIYKEYFDHLKNCIPQKNWGNFYNIGHDVLEEHLMSYYNKSSETDYINFVRLIVYHTYYHKLTDEQILSLNSTIDRFFHCIESLIVSYIEDYKPDVVGLTAYKCTIQSAMFVFKLIKERFPSIKTVMGGGIFLDTHSIGSENYNTLLKYSEKFIDKIIIGQGEVLLYKYLEGLLPEDKRVYTAEDVNNEILGFENMGLPDYSEFKMDNYISLPATSSRSCPYKCSFCSAKRYYGEYCKKNAKQTVSEMSKLREKYGQQLFFMTDHLLNNTVPELSEEIISQKLSLYYDTYFRIDKKSMNVENTLKWRKGGLYRVRLGVESGSQKILDLMGKKITIEQIKDAVSALAFAGIKTTLYIVIGHPHETIKDFEATLKLIEEIKDDIYQAECNPFQYFSTNQSQSSEWEKLKKPIIPDKYSEMEVFRSWTLNLEPLRKETYERVCKFVEFCKKLGIPNPYSLNEYISADERWKNLHRNAVPAVIDFLKREEIKENLSIDNFQFASSVRDDNASNFNF